MLRKLYVVLAFILASVAVSHAQSGEIKGKVVDKATKEGIPFCVVTVTLNGVNAGGAQTDIDGVFQIKPLNPGTYVIKVQYTGYQPMQINGVIVSESKTTYFENPPIELTATAVTMTEAVIVDYKEPLIDPETKSGGTVTREEFLAMPSKNINSVAATTAGVYQSDEGAGLNMRGQRDGGTAYFIDGQRVIGSANLPQQSIEQVTVITGGVPAQYGDASGGVINITTRGPQSEYFGGVELISSEVLDKFGYNFVGFSVGGPIWMKSDTAGNKSPVLGFILSGEGSDEKDPDPSAIGTYRVNDDTLAYLEANPLRPAPNGAGFVRNSEFTHMDDLEHIAARQNVESKTLRLNAKLDFKPTENLNITLGGSIDYNRRHDYIYEYALFNPSNNPMVNESTWRVYARLTQRFGNETANSDEGASNIKNAYYTLQVGYTQYKKVTDDDSHKENLFEYGHIGTFHQYKTRTFAPGTVIIGPDTLFGYVQSAYSDSALAFDPHYYSESYYDYTGSYDPNSSAGSDVNDPLNPLETNYTSYVYANSNGDIVNGDDVRANLGLLNGDRPTDVYSLWYNTGRQYPGYHISDNTQFRVSTSFSADIKDHAIQVGFEFEQRTERGYDITASSLWTRMRQLANLHLTQLDLANPHQYDFGTYDAFLYDRKYDASQQRYFDKSLRSALGLAENSTDWIDIDALPPSFFTMDMFSADDLLLDGNNIVSYYGYDFTGARTKGTESFDDFFTQQDANGNFTRAVGAFRPIYMAGYIQDHFDFKDLKFNVGLRIDRFDANQKVLKDKYLFYEAKTVGEVSNFTHPDNMGDDYVVYVDANPANQIVGYRNGSTWYDKDGNEVADPSVIAQSTQTGQITPYLEDPSQTSINTKAFKDYEPQLNFMPRIAFAFPISDEANFFAHYDVLTQRPTDAYRLDPLQYYYIANRVALFNNNPDLKPQRTTDYELGFTQTLSARKNAAITLSAFYREMRNMIQTVSVNYAYPANYLTFGNIDFGTVKGFTVAYDLRRTGGVQLTASYTLQFADGTGSGYGSGANLVSAGQPNLRTTIPLDFDQRHSIVMNVDYRFGSGANYHGPVVGKNSTKLFDNVGANLVFRAGSGTPYSKQTTATPEAQFGVASRQILEGSINGSRLPWQVRVDLRIDKDIDLHWGGDKDGNGQKMANLNVYLQVLNVLDTRNVLGIYRYTGNALDDGYLAAAEYQSTINGQNDPTSFRDLYSVKVANPSHYSIPRRIRLGVMLDF